MIKELEWDSNYWNINIANCIYENEDEIVEYLNGKNVDLIQTQVNINKTEDIRKLENLNFKFIELNVTYHINIESNKMYGTNFTVANKCNLNDIQNIANQVFISSRYNVINIEKTKEFYKMWAKKSIMGELDDVCLIQKDEMNQTEGFITIKAIDENSARIGLIGVKPGCQNKLVGTHLLNQAKIYLLAKGIKSLFVSTQGSNIRAQNFYAKNKFQVVDISVWLYLFL
ncbi:GNAT family N-acetyltransferase [Clostridium estertheticum]|uniref:GNAT family N-acetyltransferase n=1 Tax=Clostridium estertheticum TaxID=238834 RepID=UPI001C0E585D|nr:GNAT family N-acetyltransferase [Clostridium estertheticum]MBU3178174.1 GNAT family N-acetyltransferase [Clostridium estertheticum]